MTPIHSMKTKKGYEFFEVASAVQKAIRRGEEEVAIYFAVELFNSGYDEYLWKRLKIIASEDVGLAEPFMPCLVYSLYQMYREQRRKGDEKHAPERLFLTHAVLLLCRARKSRLIDWSLIAAWGEHEAKDMPIPDYAYDKHNTKGRSMKRGVDHFYSEGTRLNNAVELDGEAEKKRRAYAVDTKNQGQFWPPTGGNE